MIPKNLDTMQCIKSTLRSVCRTDDGSLLMPCDLSGIETRVLAWLAKCEKLLQVYRDGKDPYISFAVEMFKVPYADVTSEQRQYGKPIVLGCGFQMGSARLQESAATYGVVFSDEECQKYIKLYRETYPEIANLWGRMETFAKTAVRDRRSGKAYGLTFNGTNKKIFSITLPSGRALHYHSPRLVKDNYGLKLAYDGIETKGWSIRTTHGGKIVENIVQAISRDILLAGMVNAYRKGFKIVGHVHDELIPEVPNGSSLTLEDLRQCMLAPLDWAPDLQIDAAGYVSTFYKKG